MNNMSLAPDGRSIEENLIPGSGSELLIDCDTCVMRDIACHDCLVSVLLGPPVSLDQGAQVALAVLADSGLIPPLRLLPGSAGAA
jgi:hypothetical protein